MNSFKVIWGRISTDFGVMFEDMGIWFDRLSAGEKLIGMCAVVLVLMVMAGGRNKKTKHEGGATRQFLLAMSLVIVVGFGIGWALDTGAINAKALGI